MAEMLTLLWKKRRRAATAEGIEFAKAGMFGEEDKFCVAGRRGKLGSGVYRKVRPER